MITRPGDLLGVVASRFVHASETASRPSIGGMLGSVPPARKTAFDASSSSVPPSLSVDVDAPLAREPALAAEQLDARAPRARGAGGVVEVVDHLVAAGEHGGDVQLAGDRLRGAGDPRTSASASYGRSSAFEGMQAQNEHSPPTRRSSTIATFSPSPASRPAATSPAGPAPITTTSKLSMPRQYRSGDRLHELDRANECEPDDEREQDAGEAGAAHAQNSCPPYSMITRIEK